LNSHYLYKEFGRRLTYIRLSKLMTQEQLAEATNLSVDFISLMERGSRAPSFTTLERLSEVLDVPVKELFDFKTEPNIE